MTVPIANVENEVSENEVGETIPPLTAHVSHCKSLLLAAN